MPIIYMYMYIVYSSQHKMYTYSLVCMRLSCCCIVGNFGKVLIWWFDDFLQVAITILI